VNGLSRLLIWSMNRRTVTKAKARVEPAQAGAAA